MNDTIGQTAGKRLLPALPALALAIAAGGHAPAAEAGATFKIDDTKWVSVGAGLRTSFRSTEGAANGGKWTNDFNLDNIRLYLNGQIHQYIKLEFNTDCQTCGDGGEMRILDAIGKFELNSMFNIWAGRMLVPAERREMNGPFYSAIYNIFATGTPFEPADFNLVIKSDGTSAGSFGRDDGATVWGSFFDGRLQYALGFFRGLRGGANVDDNILYSQRIAYNFWDVEKNPGYYTSGTYYGKGGDILTLAISNQYQEDGAGTQLDPGTFRGTAVDMLLEKVLPNEGVVTLNGEYKNYGISDGYSQASRDAGGGFAMFEGNAYDVSAMYLFPEKLWIGQFQPFVRYVNVDPNGSATREVYEGGVNYVIDGHNARISLSWQYGDLMTKGLDYSSTASGDRVNAMTLGFQWQI
ncbi:MULTISPECIES: hypothetical protein [Methylomicrobium]|uniref:Short chain amide porin n=1 Tax=Methylomicrobium album BG8 TaxID=686340 RepID=H8GNW6_METAL|nr:MULTISPECIES: hypothetical protein [Methylomicrobium]EIC28388.1 hypothetical protein Metal_0538 [Methylomicrobium album BG8]